jgi:hypothetical protein
MTDLDKFFSDADRLVARASASNASPERLAGDLARNFQTWTRDYGDIGADLSAYWVDRYAATLTSPEGKKAAVDWFGNLLALLSGGFTPQMDFPDADWEEIRETISAEADNLDIDLLTDIMTVIVERGHA